MNVNGRIERKEYINTYITKANEKQGFLLVKLWNMIAD